MASDTKLIRVDTETASALEKIGKTYDQAIRNLITENNHLKEMEAVTELNVVEIEKKVASMMKRIVDVNSTAYKTDTNVNEM
jgi:hypothetical protein